MAIVAAGITLHDALAAADVLAARGIRAWVIDLYSGEAGRRRNPPGRGPGHRQGLITVEDHRPEGGLGDAVLDAVAAMGMPLRLVKLSVTLMPESGNPPSSCGKPPGSTLPPSWPPPPRWLAGSHAVLARFDQLTGRARLLSVIHSNADVGTVVHGVAGLVAELLASRPDLDDPLGLGIELSGQIDADTGVVHHSHRMGWRESVPLAELLEQASGHRTLVEHDTKALVLAEQMFGRGQGRRSFAVVTEVSASEPAW